MPLAHKHGWHFCKRGQPLQGSHAGPNFLGRAGCRPHLERQRGALENLLLPKKGLANRVHRDVHLPHNLGEVRRLLAGPFQQLNGGCVGAGSLGCEHKNSALASGHDAVRRVGWQNCRLAGSRGVLVGRRWDGSASSSAGWHWAAGLWESCLRVDLSLDHREGDGRQAPLDEGGCCTLQCVLVSVLVKRDGPCRHPTLGQGAPSRQGVPRPEQRVDVVRLRQGHPSCLPGARSCTLCRDHVADLLDGLLA
mmetsp:Transcript_22612/g.85702  ORF Transcript_22612/g.85702 Transcript_22612/m.85702 type:complete len:250 (-) Transcript_22612:290-1039(-)